MKKKLTCSPFVRELEYGQNGDGYWTYESMVVQLEDCIDVLKMVHPEFDYVFLVDHSNGHDRLQPNSLTRNKLNIGHAGKQPIMHDSVIPKTLLGEPRR